eukprot:491029_1
MKTKCNLCIFILTLFYASTYAINQDIYISKIGNDNIGNGSKQNPFATIYHGQQHIRQIISKLPQDHTGNITMNIGKGIYHESLKFSINDSIYQINDKNNFVIYRGLNDNVSISGGQTISSQWTKINTNNSNITFWQTNMKGSKLNSDNNIYQLFADSKRLNMSRTQILKYNYLNTTSGVIQTNMKTIPNIQSILSTNYSMNIMVGVYESWTCSFHLVREINYDSSNGKIFIRLVKYPSHDVNDAPSGNRFFLLNNYQLLSTQTNQFYYNKTTQILYVALSTQINPNNMTMIYTINKQILSINNNNYSTFTNKVLVKRLMFNNINIEYSDVDLTNCLSSTCQSQSATFLSTATIHVTNSEKIIFNNVSVQHTGGYAVWFDIGSKNCSFTHSIVNDVGAGGIRVGVNANGVVSIKELVTNVNISNNYVTNGGYIYQMGCGIITQSAANIIIANNEIGFFRYTGISTGWTWGYAETSVENLMVSNNYIHDIGQWLLSDMGCIYTLGTQKNSIYLNNICHDVYSFNYGGWGTYTDEGSRFITFENNIVYNTKCAGHHQHYGLDNIFLNNIYAWNNLHNMDGAFLSDQAGGNCNIKSNPEACSSLTFITNIIYVNSTFNKDILDDPRKTKYENFTFDGNNYWSVEQKTKITFPDDATIGEWEKRGKDVQVAIANPMFVDAKSYNFNLQLGSPAIALGFHPINTQNNGPNWK